MTPTLKGKGKQDVRDAHPEYGFLPNRPALNTKILGLEGKEKYLKLMKNILNDYKYEYKYEYKHGVININDVMKYLETRELEFEQAISEHYISKEEVKTLLIKYKCGKHKKLLKRLGLK